MLVDLCQPFSNVPSLYNLWSGSWLLLVTPHYQLAGTMYSSSVWNSLPDNLRDHNFR